MKTFKILFAAVIIAGFATTVKADDPVITNPTKEIGASALVVAAIELGDDTRDLNFGTIGIGNEVNMNPSSGNKTNAGDNSEFGAISLVAAANTQMNISWTNEALLLAGADTEEPGANEVMNWTPIVSQLEGATTLDDFGGVTFSEGPLSSTSGNVVFYIGGDLTVGENQDAGTYNGSFTIEVVYN